MVEQVERQLGGIVGLVNNAGIQTSSLLAMTTDAAWDEVLDVNLSGAFRVTREVLRHMVSRRRGAIVNVSSLSALHGVPGHAAYSASKAGLIAMTRCVAREMGRRNIRVNAVVPGYVATDMTFGLPESSVRALRCGEVLPHGTDPASVAEVVLFLLCDGARSITGQTIIVDAGTTA
jgi:3-oxoacyl-[acyl-carrier protein] reductase